jgi:Zn-dependent M28 family amino/carboxypeptidase
VKLNRSRAAVAAVAVLGVGSTFLPSAQLGAQAATPVAGASVVQAVGDRAPLAAKPRKNKDPFGPASRKLRANVTTKAIVGHLRELEVVAERYGDRAAGRQGYNASSRYLESVLRRAGYDPQRQYFDFTYSELISQRLTVGEDDFANNVMTGSPNTPPDGVTAALVQPAVVTGCDADAWNGVDATGAIALVSRGVCSFAEKSIAAGEAGALGTVIYNNAEGELNGTLGEAPEGATPTTGITQAAGEALVTQLGQGPVEATLVLDQLIEERRTWNVIVETARGRADNVVLMGAHLDGVQDGPGMSDNGTGAAALLETAVQLKKQTKQLTNKVRFAWWGAEELGLLGSNHYVNDLVANDPGALDDLAVYLNYDMIGSPNYRIGVYDADGSGEPADAPVPAGSIETERAFRGYFRGVDQPVVDTQFSGRSDYQAFILNDVASGGLFTGADGVKTESEARLFGGEAGITYDPNYHSPGDDLANVSRKALTITSNAIAHMTAKLGRTTRAIDIPSGGRSKARRVPAVLPEGVTRR